MGGLTTILSASSVLTFILTRFFADHLPFSTTSTFLLLAIIHTIALLIYHIILWPYLLSPLRHLPGPQSTNWLFGEFFTILRLPTGEPHKAYLKIPNSGLLRYLGIWNRERLIPTNTRTLQQVLTTDADVWVKPKMIRRELGLVTGERGILFADGEVHRAQRRILNPAFHRRNIKNLVPVFWEKAVLLGVKVQEQAVQGQLVDFSLWSSLATLDVIGAAGLGYEFSAMKTGGNGNELAQAYAVMFSQSPAAHAMRIAAIFLPQWFLYWLPFRRNREIRAAHKTLKTISSELVAMKRRELLDVKRAGGELRDILSVMLNSGEYDTADGTDIVRDQLMTFLAAGHETTATLLVWAIHILTLHPQIQEQLRAELHAAFPGGCPQGITYEALEGLKYLRNFTEETLRFFPPIAMTMRESRRDTMLDGVFVRKGTMLVVVPWALHKDPKIWGEDADLFRPDRWEGRIQGGEGSNYDLLTFLAGPRHCIGSEFARVEFKALLAVLVGRFTFKGTVGEKVEIRGGITSRPKHALVVEVGEVAWQ